MSAKALGLINPKYDDLSKIDDRGIKELFKMHRGLDYGQICGCCGERPHYTEEEIRHSEENLELIRAELNTRGHIPTKAERKANRIAKIKKGH